MLIVAESENNLDLMATAFGIGHLFGYTLIVVPPAAGVSMLSAPGFAAVAEAIPRLASAPGVLQTSVNDFNCVAFSGVRGSRSEERERLGERLGESLDDCTKVSSARCFKVLQSRCHACTAKHDCRVKLSVRL